MEQFVLGIFQEKLSQFIVGFHKEQVNANLLNGKGEIKNVVLNCAVLNDLLKKVTPFVQLESVHVSKLSFHVTSWANLKKAPIVVDIEDVTAVIVEPLGFLDRSQRKTARQISRGELNELIQQGLHKLRGAYNLFDRIADNIHVEMRSLSLTFQPRGKFKTCRIGMWTPPTICIELRHIKYISVDEYGQEGSPEQVWNHNRHIPGQTAQQRAIMIYKKLSLQCSMWLKDAVSGEAMPRLIRDAQVEVHVAFRKRLRDAAVLAVQVDVTARKVEVHVPTESVAMLAHAIAGVQYCVAKDRAFQDPLISEKEDASRDEAEFCEAKVVTTEEEGELIDEDGSDDDEDDEGDEDDTPLADVSVSDSDDYGSVGDDVSMDESMTKPGAPVRQASSMSGRGQSGYLSRPVIVLPNGLVIHERLSMSFSVHQCTVRGIYSESDDGYVQLVTKGLVAEAMWPKDTGDKGGYVQASLSYISLQEKYGSRLRSILLGGVQHDVEKLPIGMPGKPRPEKGADLSFPLFEDRSIRPDPFGLRHTFPEQAFGLKTTIDYIEKVSNPDEEEVKVLHEVGMDQFDFLVDADAWCRALRFAMNEDGNGFDSRWHSGDWSEELSPEMLVDPTSALDLSEHLQPTKEIFLDENAMISSDLMNITTRIMNVEVRVPAAIQKDVRSCDVILSVSETMVVVSSALPRTFLTGKIGASIRGEGAEGGGRIQFPNDPSDLCYSLEASEDPSLRQLGTMAAKGISTARCQLTIRGLSLRLVPVIPFCNAVEAQQLLEPTEMTMIVCFEGEAETPDSNLIGVVLFISLQFHRLAFNVDFDVITGALSTILYHNDVVQETLTVVKELQSSLRASRVDTKCGDETRMTKNMKNRRVLVRRQIAKSREAGGLSISACMQLAEFSFTMWRQNVPLTSRFRASLINEVNIRVDDTPIALMKLILFEMKGLEVGVELFIQQMVDHRIVLKACISELKMDICDFETECEKCSNESINRHDGNSGGNLIDDLQVEQSTDTFALIEILTFGLHAHEHRSYAEVAYGQNDFLLRAEDHLNSSRSMSLACEVGPPGVVYLRVRELECLSLLVIEAFLMPTGLEAKRFKKTTKRKNGLIFPDRSVGELFAWLVCAASRSVDDGVVVEESTSETSEVDEVLHSSVLKLLPEKTRQVMAQLMVVDVLVFVPDKPAVQEATDETRWLGLVVHQTRLLGGYFSQDNTKEQHSIMTTVASEGIDWSSLFVSQEAGIHLLVKARPSLYNGVRKDSICVTTECLVSEFEITCSYHPSDFSVSMGDTTLSVKNLDDLNHLHKSLLAVKDQGVESSFKLGVVLSALRQKEMPERSKIIKSKQDEAVSTTMSRPIDDMQPIDQSSEMKQSILGLRRSLTRLREVSEAHSLQLKGVLEEQKRKIGVLRYEVFLREKDRIAALALISSQTTGWLKMGGTHVYGQRLSGVTTMWRYYAVLHKSFLILYSAPGQSKPMDIVFLKGASLFPLAGGRRKRDVKLGFSIIESGGVVRFFFAESAPEFERWILDIDEATGGRDSKGTESMMLDLVNGEEMASGERSYDLPSSPSRDVVTGDVHEDSTPRKAQVRERLSAVTSSTKSKLGSAAAGAKTKIGPAAAGTKNLIGSAVQAAKHRGLNRRDDTDGLHPQSPTRQRSDRSTTSLSSDVDSVSSGELDVGVTPQRRVGGRFAAVKAGTKNKFGSALQAAKEKGKAAAEQRRRRIHDRAEQAMHLDHNAMSETVNAGVEAQSIPEEVPIQLPTTAVPLEESTTPSTGNEGPAKFSDSLEAMEASGSEDGVAQLSTVETDLSTATSAVAPTGSARGQQLKSKLGAAVKSVRRGTQRNSSREDNDDSAFFDPSNALKLKGIHVGHGDPAELLGKHFIDVDVDLKRIDGCWIASVEACTIEKNDESPSAPEMVDDKPLPPVTTDALQEDANEAKETDYDKEENDEDLTSADPSRQSRLEGAYKISIGFAKDRLSSSEEGKDMVEVTRSLSDLLSLQSALSESVSRVIVAATLAKNENDANANSDSPTEEEMNSLDLVRLAGRLLRGLVETGSDDFEGPKEFHDYQCELVKEFLNLAIDTALPLDGVEVVSRFLECPVGASPPKQFGSTEILDDFGPAIEPPIASSQEILACTVACENDLLRLETQGSFASRPVLEDRMVRESGSKDMAITFVAPVASMAPPRPFLEPLLPFEITESLHGALHNALMKIMTERDESHAQLIAASVLHVHEMEQERKRVDRLTQQLKETQELVKAAQMQNVAGNFFADRKLPEPNRDSTRSKLTALQEAAIQNSEQEMLMLCQQLASEISAKTSASLEIIRLKESRKMEQENEHAEKLALQNELKRCKELLALQKRKTDEATQQANAWKEAYEKSKENHADEPQKAS